MENIDNCSEVAPIGIEMLISLWFRKGGTGSSRHGGVIR